MSSRGKRPLMSGHEKQRVFELEAACRAGSIDTISQYIKDGLPVDAATGSPQDPTVLFAAARSKHARSVEALLLAGASPSVTNVKMLTPLHLSATGLPDDPETASVLVQAGAPVNAVDLGGNTPLCAAVVAGNLSIVKFLLSCRDAQPDLARADGQTARSLATTSSDPRLLALFRGIPVINASPPVGWLSLLSSSSIDGGAQLRRALEAGADPSIYRESGKSLLHKAVEMRAHHAVRALLDSGVTDVDARDPAGNSALHTAVSIGDVTAVHAFLAAGANTSVVNNDGHTPVTLAASLGRTDMCALLYPLSSPSVVSPPPLPVVVRKLPTHLRADEGFRTQTVLPLQLPMDIPLPLPPIPSAKPAEVIDVPTPTPTAYHHSLSAEGVTSLTQQLGNACRLLEQSRAECEALRVRLTQETTARIAAEAMCDQLTAASARRSQAVKVEDSQASVTTAVSSLPPLSNSTNADVATLRLRNEELTLALHDAEVRADDAVMRLGEAQSRSDARIKELERQLFAALLANRRNMINNQAAAAVAASASRN